MKSSENNQSLDVKSFYEKEGLAARRYNSKNFWEKRYHQKKAALVHSILIPTIHKNSLVLDAGSGTGELSMSAKRLGGQVVSVDVAKSYLRRLRGLIENRVCASLDCLPFRSIIFDVVLCADVIEHLPSLSNAIEELNRVSSSFVVITTPCSGIARHLFGKFFPNRLAYIDNSVGHLQVISLSKLEQKLAKINWSVNCRSYHVLQPIADNFLSKQFSIFVGFVEKTADIMLPNQGTISLAVASHCHQLPVRPHKNRSQISL